MRVADLGDVKLNWREDGDPSGQPVVFANSLGTDLRVWDDVIPLLPDGFRYIRYDKRGHGLSSSPTAPYTMDQLVGDAEALLTLLGVKQTTFVGLSIGGMIGQGLASKRPDLVRTAAERDQYVARGEHHLERHVGFLHRRNDLGCVFEYHIVIGHAVDQQKRIADLGRIGDGAGFLVASGTSRGSPIKRSV